MPNEPPQAYIIAGPNGSGKTTFATEFLPHYADCKDFVNADLIAQGLSPFDPGAAAFQAGKLVLQQIQGHVREGRSFAFETTLSGRSLQRWLREVKIAGYRVHLCYLWVPSPEVALGRIAERVREGGHDVPEQAVRRRFARGLQNLFRHYLDEVDSWLLFDNSGGTPRLVAKRQRGEAVIHDAALFARIREDAGP